MYIHTYKFMNSLQVQDSLYAWCSHTFEPPTHLWALSPTWTNKNPPL